MLDMALLKSDIIGLIDARVVSFVIRYYYSCGTNKAAIEHCLSCSYLPTTPIALKDNHDLSTSANNREKALTSALFKTCIRYLFMSIVFVFQPYRRSPN